MKKGPYKPKIRNKPCVCKYCGADFLAADVKANICDACKIEPAKNSTCLHCGAPAKTGNKFCSKFCSTTYHYTHNPDTKMGHRSGEDNVAKTARVREKISIGVTKSYIHNPELIKKRAIAMSRLQNNGSKYRSNQEIHFSQFLEQHNIEYLYEEPQYYYTINKNSVVVQRSKLIDFTIPKINLSIELTGFIFGSKNKKSTDYFRERLLQLASENPYNIYIISSEDDRIVQKVQAQFEGWHPWDFREMRLSENLKILSYMDLKAYILKEYHCGSNN